MMADEIVGSGWGAAEKVGGSMQWHWFRVSGRRVLSLAILSTGPVWYVGHYRRSRMEPCTGTSCQGCAEGLGKQLRFVFAVAETSTRRAGLLEVGQYVAELLHEWEGRNQGLRGMWVEVSKHTQAIRSRMEVSYIDRPVDPRLLELEVPDVRDALRRTWAELKKTEGPGIRMETASVSSGEKPLFRRPKDLLR